MRTLDKLRTWVRMVLLRWLGEVHGYVGTDGAPPGGDRVARGNTSGSRGVGGNRGSGDEAGEPMDVGDGGDVPLASVEEQEAQADMEAWGAQLDLSVHQILCASRWEWVCELFYSVTILPALIPSSITTCHPPLDPWHARP